MDRRLLAGMLGMALVGCQAPADLRGARPTRRVDGPATRSGPGAEEPVRLAPVPSLASTINNGRPADPPAAPAEPLGATPADSPSPSSATNAAPAPAAEIVPIATDPAPDEPEARAPSAPADPALKPVRHGDEATIRSDIDLAPGRPTAEAAAIVGDAVISLRQLKAAVRERLKGGPPWEELSRDQRNQVAKATLEALIEREVILHEARRKAKDPKQWAMFMEYAEKEWNEKEIPALLRRRKVADKFALSQALAESGESLEDLRESYKRGIISQEYLMLQLRSKLAKPGLPELQAYYREHLADFDRPAAVTWREIFLPIDATTAAPAARRRAEALLDRLRRGEDFAALARAESKGPTAAKGGEWKDMAYASHSTPAVKQALASLEPGRVSPVLEGPNGLHILRVESRRPAGPAPFVEVQKTIAERLFEREYRRTMDAYLKSLRDRTPISSPLFAGTDSAPTFTEAAR